MVLALMSASVARIAALEVLTRVRERDAYAHETLDAVLKAEKLDPRDAALATRLAYGAVAARGTLDEAVVRVADPGTRLHPQTSDVLALGAYEVLFAGTPAWVAVSEAVKLAKSSHAKSAGLVNAIMRRIVRDAESFPWGDPAKDNAALARLHAHPRWLAELWIAELGRDTAASVMAANNAPAPFTLASLEPTADAAETLSAELVSLGAEPQPSPLPGSLTAEKPALARKAAALRAQRALVMDAGAQFAVHAMRPAPGQILVDIGAGRGGKSLLLAALARRAGGPLARLIAVDLHGFKLDQLATAAGNLGFEEIETTVADATLSDLATSVRIEEGTADAVLVDAPCSGLGTLRRHPDRRWRAKPDEIEALASLGSLLLERASRLVKPGGFVVYSTCTITREENAEVVEGFLGSEAGKGFAAGSLEGFVPEAWAGYVSSEGWFQSLPEPGGADGHFVARLERKR